jgi:hypothetical protein
MIRQIFMSYAQGDEAFAVRLTDDLNRTGATVWLDIRNARPGRHWARSIEQALSESSMMIVVLSPAALQEPHVSVEWQAYLEAYRPVIPVLARPCDPPGPLRTRRPIDFTRDQYYSRAVHQLVSRLLESGTRVRRNDPVIWTMTESVMDFRDEHRLALPDDGLISSGPDTGVSPSGLRRMVHGLREMLRRGASVQ